MRTYTPENWYWLVGPAPTKVFSSAVGDYIALTNATYLAWLAPNAEEEPGIPTKIDTEANLGDVLAPLLIRPVAVGILDGYQDSHAGRILTQAVFKILFNHENRLRVLEGKVPLTAAQAKAAVKALM